MKRLADKSIIITGASRGIGAATAEAMAGEGAAVTLVARSGDAIDTLAQKLRDAGGKAEAMTCDVSRYEDLRAVVARTQEAFGRVDVLVNNAAVIDPIGPMSRTDPQAWADAADINFKGVYFGMRAALPAMLAQGSGTIINIGSGAAHNPLEGWSNYCASKAGAIMLLRCAHLENKGRGIRFFSLSPGTVATDMQRKIKASGINPVSQMDFSQHIPPEWPAQALVWLCTEDAAEFSGEEVSLRDEAIRARVGLG